MKRRQHRNINNSPHSKGQAMVEYIVILVALSAALISAGNGSIGFSKDDKDSLVQALHNRYTTQAYALSISEIPEGRDLGELADYYVALDKYPGLSPKLRTADKTLDKLTSGLENLNKGIDSLKKYADPKNALDLIDTDTVKDQIKNELENALNPF
jgi:Flp pilus assembly pilin Flp